MQPPSYSRPTPVNGTLILILGILSIIGMPILGPVAWIMGNNGLSTIDHGNGDFQQRQNTVIGRVCGIIGTVLLILGVLCAIVFFAFGAAIFKTALDQASGQHPAAVTRSATPSGHKQSASLGEALSSAITANDDAKVKAIAHKKPALLNARNAQGETPIFQAVTEGKPAMASLLLKLGANVNAKDNTGLTPLDKAQAMGKEDVLAVLVSHGGRSARG